MQLQFKVASLRFWKIWYASPSGMYLHLNRVKRRLIFDQQPKTHPCHRGKIWGYAGYFVYITDSNCISLDQMIREALNKRDHSEPTQNYLGATRLTQYYWNSHRCVSPLPKDQKTRFEVEILTTVWYQGKGHLIMFIGTNIRKLNWNKSSIYITDKEYFNFKHDC